MSSFYLQNEFLLSLELRRHTETTLHYGHLHDNKCKKKSLDQIFWANRFIVAIELFCFPYETSLEEFVARTGRAITLRIILHEICTSTYANGWFLVLFFFFLPGRKKCHGHVNGFGDIPFTSLVCHRAKNLKKIFFLQQTTWVKWKTFTKSENLQGHLWHLHTCIAFLTNVMEN